jgi:hypothetical protein
MTGRNEPALYYIQNCEYSNEGQAAISPHGYLGGPHCWIRVWVGFMRREVKVVEEVTFELSKPISC